MSLVTAATSKNTTTNQTFVVKKEILTRKTNAIFEALDFDSTETCDYFLERASEVPIDMLINLRDMRLGNEGRTLLHNAARKGSLAAVLYLIRNGHVIDVVDSAVSKLTPLMDAITFQRNEIALILVEAGASLFKCDVNGENALHYIARTDNTKMLRTLITASQFSRDEIMDLANTRSIKKRLPEELCFETSMCFEILQGLRTNGRHGLVIQIQAQKLVHKLLRSEKEENVNSNNNGLIPSPQPTFVV